MMLGKDMERRGSCWPSGGQQGSGSWLRWPGVLAGQQRGPGVQSGERGFANGRKTKVTLVRFLSFTWSEMGSW